MAREMWDVREARSSMVETEASPRRLGALGSRRERSCTRLEKDMVLSDSEFEAEVEPDYCSC